MVSKDFKDPQSSFLTLFKFMLGIFDEPLVPMQDKNFWFTFMFFLLFLVLFIFILVNMYLATMMVTYAQTSNE